MDKGAGLLIRGARRACAHHPRPPRVAENRRRGSGWVRERRGGQDRDETAAAVSRVSRRARRVQLHAQAKGPSSVAECGLGPDADADAHARWPVWM